ncbi:DUF6194 family protein [Actinopolyspora mortivallis]|uniref:DUF6194 family protein n=1 Tax=Actinopolyspora mortivallis TaxID=33906 RepID=UPI003CCB9F1A
MSNRRSSGATRSSPRPEQRPHRRRRVPFTTIVTKDYDGWYTVSELNRAGVFRLNLAMGRTVLEELIGYPPAEHEHHTDRFDYTALDRIPCIRCTASAADGSASFSHGAGALATRRCHARESRAGQHGRDPRSREPPSWIHGQHLGLTAAHRSRSGRITST